MLSKKSLSFLSFLEYNEGYIRRTAPPKARQQSAARKEIGVMDECLS